MQRLRILLPDLDKLADQLYNHWAYYFAHWLDTLSVSVAACVLAATLAAAVSIAGLRYPLVLRTILPLAALSQSFPLQALGPVILIALGPGTTTRLAIALTITYFPIQSAIATAFADTPNQYLMFAQTCRASFVQTFWSLRVPFALPRIISALKTGFTLSVMGAVVAEFISPQGGIGEILLISQSSFNVEAIYICVAILMVQGVSIYLLLSAIEQRLVETRT